MFSIENNATVAPGQTLALLLDLREVAPPQFFSFSARAGVEPTPWRDVYAFPPGAAPTEKPAKALDLSLGDGPQVAKEYPLFGFASPGVLVGSAKLASSPCPVDNDWKNHGQYVRCVSHAAEDSVAQGTLTQEEADILVSAAAQSEVGKK